MSVVEALPEAREGLELEKVDCVSGMGVVSLLVCVVCKLPAAVEVDLGTGGMYVWPRAGVKMGRVEAVESILVRDVTVDNCSLLASRSP